MAERSKAAVLKTVSGETRSRVQIPVPPPQPPVQAVVAEGQRFRRSAALCKSRSGLKSLSLRDLRSWRLAGDLRGRLGCFSPLRGARPCRIGLESPSLDGRKPVTTPCKCGAPRCEICAGCTASADNPMECGSAQAPGIGDPWRLAATPCRRCTECRQRPKWSGSEFCKHCYQRLGRCRRYIRLWIEAGASDCMRCRVHGRRPDRCSGRSPRLPRVAAERRR